MNYEFHYISLIDRAKSREIFGYVERHHIIPRCLGGSDDMQNIAVLTAEEHYVAHQLLVKMYPDVRGLATAATRMAKQCSGRIAYGWLRRRHAEAVSARQKGNTYNVGRVRPKHEKDRISASTTGIKKSEETKRKMSLAQKGNSKALGLVRGPMSEAHKLKVSIAKTGVVTTIEVREKISAALKGRPISKEALESRSVARLAKIQAKINLED